MNLIKHTIETSNSKSRSRKREYKIKPNLTNNIEILAHLIEINT